ncbi:hypothetical protein RhiirA4_452289 [Rhizophagus irregularis]|uniref:Ion transport domain-containing protein n=1 Tax=Rhizophagus irregularis TaxID=588596 RepID=A0A2I1FXT5_9GLOM|nr:hypothetical protein RhiirA4_452289 [Rhizophagus irregularis]
MSQIDDEIYVEIDDKIDHNNDIHHKIDLDNDINKPHEISDDKIDSNNDIQHKIDIDNDINKPHNGKLVTKIEVSPNEKYLVTYSEEDHSIVGWNIESKDKSQLELDKTFKLSDMILFQMCVSDNKKLAYINENKYLEIYDMKKNQKIKLDCDPRFSHYYYCTFNLNGEFILYGRFDRIIFIYSTRTKNNKWNCKRMYKKQNNFKFISISKYDKLYSFSNNSIYEYNLITEKNKKIFGSKEKITNKNIRISSNEKFICIRIINKLIIYSIELEIPIASWDINNDTQLHNFVYRAGLIPLLFPLLNDNTIMEHYWNECLGWLRDKGQLSNEYQTESLSDIIRTTTKYVFGILDGHIWKVKFEEILSKMNLTFENTDENIENWYFDNDFKISNEIHKTYDHLNIHLIKPSMDTIYALFQKVKPHSKNKKELESSQNLIKWEINTLDACKIKLKVFKKINVNNQWNEEDLICTRVECINESLNLLEIKLLDDSDIIILTSIGLFIYHFNENNKSISLNYYYYMIIDRYSSNVTKNLKNYKQIFSKSTLPLPNYDSFKCYNGWSSYIKDNKESLLKYGVELLTFGIKEHNLELIEDIYKACIKYFNEDLRNNRMYLSIITSTMPLLSEYYPEYISRYSFKTTMIIDPSFYSIKYENVNLHLYSFQYHQLVNLTRSIWWLKYNTLMEKLRDNYNTIYRIINIIQILIILPILPIYFITFFIFSKFNFINNIEEYDIFSIYFKITKIFDIIFLKIFKHTKTPTITFMNPYIKFINYPKEYNWFLELIIPQPSPYVETICKDIYKTWNGETLIDFKWNTYGKYYYIIIWIGFIFLLGCFTAAATIPQQYINNDIQQILLVISIVLGFIHLIFEIRQFIYNPIKWIHNFWNIFDLIAFTLPIYTSIYWLQTNDKNNITQLLSFSCLFLDIKFLLFFRVFESFGIYFAIIISVGKKVSSFLVVLFIIIISFAHTFFILLSPTNPNFSFKEYTNNSDQNNPWNIVPTYHQVFKNGTMDLDSSIIQQPDENTNMFMNFGTSLFAMYLFLTGDSNALSNWTYINNPSLVILIVLFSLYIVVYLMNLFIGLLSNAIEKDNNRISFLIQKAEILAEIELFYLLPHQRRWKEWFPEVIYYYANVDKTREKIKEMINEGEWNTNEFSELKQKLLKELNIQYDFPNLINK